jgi:PTH1 family peptidyl-tRNA hydrolase
LSESLHKRLRRLATGPRAEQGPELYRVRLVVGLGNPGSEYSGNRHNVGQWVVNRLARRHDMQFDASGQASLGEGRIAGRKVALAKPRTYVNESGKAVWNLIKRLKLDDAHELLVICDDLDLPLGKVRLRPTGGHGGHKGLQSIIAATGNDQFPRLRIGIGRPVVRGDPSYDPEVIANYVLSDPPPEEREVLDQAVERAVEVIELVVTQGVEAAMRRYN